METSKTPVTLGDLLTAEEAAKALRCHYMTLSRQRMDGKGIPYIKCGRKVFYRRADIEAYLSSCYIDRTQAA